MVEGYFLELAFIDFDWMLTRNSRDLIRNRNNSIESLLFRKIQISLDLIAL